MENKTKFTTGQIRTIIVQLILFIICLTLLAIIFFIKAKSLIDWKIAPFLFGYTIFVTLFQLARLVAAVFSNHFLSKTTSDKNWVLTSAPFVSFIVPCKNEEAAIAKTINKCFEADYPKDKIEVIFVNDGSTDGTLSVVEKLKAEKHPAITILGWKENHGKREAMAAGFRASKGEIIIQLDSDSFIDPSTFRYLIEPFQDPRVGAVCGHTDPANPGQNFITKMQSAYYYLSFRVWKAAESSFYSVFCCSGCFSAYRKSAVMPILENWLFEKFLGKRVMFGDDRSLTSWVLKQGYKTLYSPYAKAYTIVPSTMRQIIIQQIRWKKSWVINSFFTLKFIIKGDPIVGLFYFLPLVLVSILTPIVVFWGLVLSPEFILFIIFSAFSA